MACFIVSAAEAAVITVVEKQVEKKEQNAEKNEKEMSESMGQKVSLSTKLKWLTYMLWGGVVMLAFEHVWHGEVVPWFPFLTAMADPGDAAEMFHEMATVGVCMAVLITAVWAVMCRVADLIIKKPVDNKIQKGLL